MGDPRYLKKRDAAADKYNQQTQQAMKDALDNIKKTTELAIKNNRAARDQNIRDVNAFNSKVQNEDLYSQGLNKAMGGAANAAANQAQQAQNASRAAGMSKSAAAEAGMSAANQGFNQGLAQQQAMATNDLQNRLGMQANNLAMRTGERTGAMGRENQYALGGADKTFGAQQYGAEGHKNTASMNNDFYRQAYDDTGELVGTGISAAAAGAGVAKDLGEFKYLKKAAEQLPSDERLKDFDSKDDDPWANVDALLKKHYKGDK